MDGHALVILATINKLWFMLPLVISVSLVYAATRHEQMRPILIHAVRFAAWIGVFMAVIFGLLVWLSSRL